MPASVAIRRVATIAGAVAALLLVVGDGLARIAAPVAVRQAGGLGKHDAAVLAASASGRLELDDLGASEAALEDPARRRAAGDEATRALRRDLTQVEALAVLGRIAAAEGRAPAAHRFMAASDALSRRNLTTRLWFIDEAVGRGDVAGALRHFDLALRSSTRASDILFPVLGEAINEDPALVQPIANLLRSNPAWSGSFIYYAANAGVAPARLGTIYAQLSPKPDHAGQDLGKLLVDTMIARRQFDAARALDLRLAPRPGSPGLLNDAGFAAARGYAPFDWSFSLDSGLDIARDRNSAGTGLAVEGSIFDGVTAASQLVALRPGSYVFGSMVTDVQDGSDVRARWTLECVDVPLPVARLVVAADGKPARARWTVPASCPAQWLRLAFEGGDGMTRKRVFVRPILLQRLPG